MILVPCQIVDKFAEFCSFTVAIVVFSNEFAVGVYIGRLIGGELIHLSLQFLTSSLQEIMVLFRGSQMSAVVSGIFGRTSGPYRMFIRLNDVFVDTAENHGSHIPVTDRQGFAFPYLCRGAIGRF